MFYAILGAVPAPAQAARHEKIGCHSTVAADVLRFKQALQRRPDSLSRLRIQTEARRAEDGGDGCAARRKGQGARRPWRSGNADGRYRGLRLRPGTAAPHSARPEGSQARRTVPALRRRASAPETAGLEGDAPFPAARTAAPWGPAPEEGPEMPPRPGCRLTARAGALASGTAVPAPGRRAGLRARLRAFRPEGRVPGPARSAPAAPVFRDRGGGVLPPSGASASPPPFCCGGAGSGARAPGDR